MVNSDINTFFRSIFTKLPYNSKLRASFEGWGLIFHQRHIEIARFLPKPNSDALILEIGAGKLSSLRLMGYNTLTLDVKPKPNLTLVASASYLPFHEKAFDYITAVDILEHIPKVDRAKAIKELKRAGKSAIVHVPLSDGKNFAARTGDFSFYCFIKKLGFTEENTIEHLKCGEPSPEEFLSQGFKIIKVDWNLNIFLFLMEFPYFYQKKTFNKIRSILWYPSRFMMSILNSWVLSHIKSPPWYGGYLLYTIDHN